MSTRDFLFLSYHTAPDIPPPQAFEALFRIGPGEDGHSSIRVEVRYAGREEIPLEELEAEGFSPNDDWNWVGRLPDFWRSEWENTLSKSHLTGAQERQVQLARGKTEAGDWQSPEDQTFWVELAEELLQACLEASERESPMVLSLGKLEKQNFYEKVRIEWRFSSRQVRGLTPHEKPKSFPAEEWKNSRSELQAWLESEAEKQDLFAFPNQKGWFWLLNEDIWIPYTPAKRGTVRNWAVGQCPELREKE